MILRPSSVEPIPSVTFEARLLRRNLLSNSSSPNVNLSGYFYASTYRMLATTTTSFSKIICPDSVLVYCSSQISRVKKGASSASPRKVVLLVILFTIFLWFRMSGFTSTSGSKTLMLKSSVFIEERFKAVMLTFQPGWQRVFKPDPSCPRFVSSLMGGSPGLGHQMAEVFLGVHTAQLLGFAYIFPFPHSLVSSHGSYERFYRYVVRHDYVRSLTKLTVVEFHSESHFEKELLGRNFNVTLECNSVVLINLANCGQPHWCTQHPIPVVEKNRYLVQQFLHLPVLLNTSCLHPVIHCRVGDISLNTKNEELFRAVFSLLKLMNYETIFLLYNSENLFAEGFLFLPILCADFGVNCSHHNDFDYLQSLSCMVTSPVVVTSGSSFSYLAAALRSDNGVIMVPPKEQERSYEFYAANDWLWLDAKGSILQNQTTTQRWIRSNSFKQNVG
jgi:hypothetical protein